MTPKEEGGRHTSGKKASQGGRGDPNTASPAAIERHLKGIKFPASKQDLIKHAKDHDAPNDVLKMLNRFPNREYGSAADVAKATSKAA